ncbi:hypothetical protein Tco_1009530 [Tanacetum coccineum]
MAALAIAISSDSSDESVGSPPSRVILFGDIPTVIPSTPVVAPETSTIAPVISSAAHVVETTLVASPTGLCGLVPYSGSDSDSPDEMSSPEHISSLPAISPFLCTDSSEALDSSDGPSSLASRRVLPCSSDHRSSSSSSSSDSSLVHSSGLDASDQAHFGSSTRDLSPRLGYPPRRAPRCKSSSGDSSERPLHSSSHSAGPSRKRCRSSVDSVSSFTPVMGSLAPTHADILPPHHAKIDPRYVRDDTEEYEAYTSAGGMVEVGIDLMSAPIVEEEIIELAGEDSSDSSSTRDGIVRSFEDMSIDLNDDVRDFYHHMSEVRIDRIVGIETVQRRLEAD